MNVSLGQASGRSSLKRRRDWFIKGHGLGNDYLVVDPSALSFPLTVDTIRALCDRHTGVGSDGILALASPDALGVGPADFGVRIYNPDGSEAEKSGNGLRIFSRFLRDYGYTRRRAFTVATLGGVVRAQLEVGDGDVGPITVDVGSATFHSRDIPVAGDPREVIDEPLLLEGDGEVLRITAVSVGNPHCVVFLPTLDVETLRRLGPRLETHPHFPHRTNVQLARVAAPDLLEMLIWERGAGETQASGTSACAAAAAAARLGLTGRTVTVSMPGGRLAVEIDDAWGIRLSGPAEEVCAGTFTGGLLRRLRDAR